MLRLSMQVGAYPELTTELVPVSEATRRRLPRWDPRLWGGSEIAWCNASGTAHRTAANLRRVGLTWARAHAEARKLHPSHGQAQSTDDEATPPIRAQHAPAVEHLKRPARASTDLGGVGGPQAATPHSNITDPKCRAAEDRRRWATPDLYRINRIDYEYAAGDDTWVPPFAAENAGDQTDPRRATPSPQQTYSKRLLYQTHKYDWLGNTLQGKDDSSNGFYDRSFGSITNSSTKPYQLTSATAPGGAEASTAYDDAGNLTRLNVHRTGPCIPAGAACKQRFDYEWDEVGRLVHARRWDVPDASGDPSADLPAATPAADLTYVYNASDQRVLKTALDASNNASHTVYALGSLELRRATYNAETETYTRDKWTEVPYLFANGVRLARVVWHEGESAIEQMPMLTSAGKQHVLFELGDHLGSTSVVLDKATGELVERSTFQGFGATESDYRPERWQGFREDYRFTGKEEDVEVGLQYFGKRFLNPYLGRWASADPLGVHAPGSADLNLYAYVRGAALKLVDPLGLQDQVYAAGQDAETGAQETFTVDENLESNQTVEFPVDKLTVAPRGGKQASGMQSAAPSPAAARAPPDAGSSGASRAERWDAAKSAARNFAVDALQGAASVAAISNPIGLLGGARLNLDALKAAEPSASDESLRGRELRDSYTFMSRGLTFESIAISAAGGGVASSLMKGAAGAARGAPQVAKAIDPNKLHHIFGQAKHKLGPLLEKFGGSQEGAFRAVEGATQTAVKNQGLTGVFKTTVEVGGQNVGVKGTVIDSTAHIGSFWIP